VNSVRLPEGCNLLVAPETVTVTRMCVATINNRAVKNQTCKACGERDKFNFDVPDHIWQAVVPSQLRQLVVCLPCFDEFARQAEIPYAHHIRSLYFVGDRATIQFVATRCLDAENYRS
jgi:hypothetical protein